MPSVNRPSGRAIGAAGAVGASAAVLALAATFIPPHEGTILRGYRDPIGVVTSCIGHTKTAVLGRTYTPEECQRLFREDLLEHADAIAPCLTRPLPVETHAAFLSFAFNVGARRFCESSLARKANAGDLGGACAELSRWVLAGGKKLPGLVKRRADERALCERGLLRGPVS